MITLRKASQPHLTNSVARNYDKNDTATQAVLLLFKLLQVHFNCVASVFRGDMCGLQNVKLESLAFFDTSKRLYTVLTFIAILFLVASVIYFLQLIMVALARNMNAFRDDDTLVKFVRVNDDNETNVYLIAK